MPHGCDPAGASERCEPCTSARSGAPAIRGVRVQSSSFGPGGKLNTDGAPIEIRFAGCQTWHKRRACPKGAVATALRAHYIEDAQGYTGLELRCHVARDVEGSPAAG